MAGGEGGVGAQRTSERGAGRSRSPGRARAGPCQSGWWAGPRARADPRSAAGSGGMWVPCMKRICGDESGAVSGRDYPTWGPDRQRGAKHVR
jgi:hypothetical protein